MDYPPYYSPYPTLPRVIPITLPGFYTGYFVGYPMPMPIYPGLQPQPQFPPATAPPASTRGPTIQSHRQLQTSPARIVRDWPENLLRYRNHFTPIDLVKISTSVQLSFPSIENHKPILKIPRNTIPGFLWMTDPFIWNWPNTSFIYGRCNPR